MKVLQNRGLWGYVIGIVAMAVALVILGKHNQGHELGHGILFALLTAVVLGVLLWIVLSHKGKTITLSRLAFLGILIAVAVVFSVVHFTSIGISWGWWDTRGFFAWLTLFLGAIAACLVSVTSSGHTVQRLAAQRQQPAQQPFQPV